MHRSASVGLSHSGPLIAEAFTATNPSVTLVQGQWEDMKDLGEKPHLFTDGVGTISRELGSMIWEALCEERQNRASLLEPSAYQIRFLGLVDLIPYFRKSRYIPF
jgi:RNA-dependent RNA polymerase